MVKLIFKDGPNVLDPNLGRQPPMLVRFKSVINGVLSPLTCPRHGVNSYATVLVNVDQQDSNWEIIDFCCAEFSGKVEAEMPSPWSHERRQ